MKVETNNSVYTTQNQVVTQNLQRKKLSSDEVEELRQQIVENTHAYTFDNISAQNQILTREEKFVQDYNDFQNLLEEIGYSGKPIASLSQEEAAELVSDDGIFGIDTTAQRISQFVINGANGDENLLRAGREGILQGFEEAKEIWGTELPEISQQTMKKTLELLDGVISELGYSILDTEV